MTVAQAAALLDRLPPTMLLCVGGAAGESAIHAAVNIRTVTLIAKSLPVEDRERGSIEVAVIE